MKKLFLILTLLCSLTAGFAQVKTLQFTAQDNATITSLTVISPEDTVVMESVVADKLVLNTKWPTGIYDKEIGLVNAYPNPTEGDINVRIPISGNYLICLYDLSGRLVTKTDGYCQQFRISGIPNGVYILAIKGEHQFSQKIISTGQSNCPQIVLEEEFFSEKKSIETDSYLKYTNSSDTIVFIAKLTDKNGNSYTTTIKKKASNINSTTSINFNLNLKLGDKWGGGLVAYLGADTIIVAEPSWKTTVAGVELSNASILTHGDWNTYFNNPDTYPFSIFNYSAKIYGWKIPTWDQYDKMSNAGNIGNLDSNNLPFYWCSDIAPTKNWPQGNDDGLSYKRKVRPIRTF
jgi:hypothetical protein